MKGWAQEIRNLGGISFLIIRDRHGIVQVTAPKKKVAPEVMTVLGGLSRESVVKVTGVAKAAEQAKGGVEVVPSSIEVLSAAASPLPMGVVDKVNVEADTRFDNRFMDLRRPEARAVFEIKSMVLDLIGDFLTGEGFLEVFTPKIVASGAEGARPCSSSSTSNRWHIWRNRSAIQADAHVHRLGPGLRDRPGLPRGAFGHREARFRVHLL